MNQSELKIGVIGQSGDGATFQNKAETVRISRLRRRQRALLDQGGGGGATFLLLISVAALTFVDSQNWPYSQNLYFGNSRFHNRVLKTISNFRFVVIVFRLVFAFFNFHLTSLIYVWFGWFLTFSFWGNEFVVALKR